MEKTVEKKRGLAAIFALCPAAHVIAVLSAALIGAFQQSDGSGMARIMQGSAWWFNDNIDGMVSQMRNLANMSAFGNFLGMLTDSRSFISYPRHEYFRRILCNLIGEWVESGLYPLDIDSLAQLVTDICYNNTKAFFGF